MKKKFDRSMNPHDGSRRRLTTEEHVPKKKYKRVSKQRIKQDYLEEWSIIHFIDEEE